MKTLKEALLLIFSYAVLYIWQNSGYSGYTIPVLGFLLVLLFIISARRKGKSLLTFTQKTDSLHVIIINAILLLLIVSTGGINSQLFFLLYFLSFGVAFVLEPINVFVFTITTLILFLPDILRDTSPPTLIKTISLVLISPLAFYFGREFRQDGHEEKKDEKKLLD